MTLASVTTTSTPTRLEAVMLQVASVSGVNSIQKGSTVRDVYWDTLVMLQDRTVKVHAFLKVMLHSV